MGDTVYHKCKTSILELIYHILLFHCLSAIGEISVVLHLFEEIYERRQSLVICQSRLAVLHQSSADAHSQELN